ncbi:hypothetical protein LTR37_019484 [Vermiconidia calcicola]|uniref:Uncharacterized protein n=1 Tax=Vermiconidia calcicola TaxID=1690605 RepID=A0ACC3ME55_9PEZI|nr:hypothetical protein LTR37_019484 [Vermiconidia calcicola]
MFQTAGYPVHPPYFSNYDYKSPPRTPPQNGGYAYYSPRQYSYATPHSKGHTRRPTNDATYTYTTYTTPRKTAHYSGAEYSSPGYYASAQSTPQRKSDYVSGSARTREGTRYTRVPADVDGKKQRKYSSSKHYSSRSQHVYDEPCDRSYEYLPRYEQYEARPPPYKRHQSYRESRADHRYYDQVPIYTQAESTEKRPRRASHTEYAAKPTHTSTPRRPTTATKAPPKATEDDARRAGIPAGYCYKNWDPTEEPILLLGSVFDANSLGKWIYDWTVFFYGPATPMAEVAGELWLLLIQLAGKIKRAEECMSRIRQQVSRDLVDDFLESGERLWQRFNKLLKICESYMWKAARKENGTATKVRMGKNSGCEFVDSIFGRDRELERTEKLMTGMRLWSMRFDANCEEILRNPSA